MIKILLSVTFLTLLGCSDNHEEFYVIPSRSMEPALTEGENVIVLRDADYQINRFDLVLVKIPVLESETVLRVIGLPGETIHIADEEIIIDNKPIHLPEGLNYSASAEMPTFYGTQKPVDIPPDRILSYWR